MFRFACALVLVLSFAPPAGAGQISVPLAFTASVVSPASARANSNGAAARQAATPNAQPPIWTTHVVKESKRPALMIPMYAGFAALQGLDYHSTTRALSSGAGREANPVMGAVVGNKGAFIALKAAATAGVVLAGEKMWRKNRVGAIVFMAVANGVMASVVAHNYSVTR